MSPGGQNQPWSSTRKSCSDCVIAWFSSEVLGRGEGHAAPDDVSQWDGQGGLGQGEGHTAPDDVSGGWAGGSGGRRRHSLSLVLLESLSLMKPQVALLGSCPWPPDPASSTEGHSSCQAPPSAAAAVTPLKTAPSSQGGSGFQLLLAQGSFTVPLMLLTPLYKVPSLNSLQSDLLSMPSVSCWEAD